MANTEFSFKYTVGDKVKLYGSGQLEGIVVDLLPQQQYVIAFPRINKEKINREFIFGEEYIDRKC